MKMIKKRLITLILAGVGCIMISFCFAQEMSIRKIQLKNITGTPENLERGGGILSPDGKKIIWFGTSTENPHYSNFHVTFIKGTITGVKCLTNFRREYFGYPKGWSPDSTQMMGYYTDEEDRFAPDQYVIIEVNTNNIIRELSVNRWTGEGSEEIEQIKQQWGLFRYAPKKSRVPSVGTITFSIKKEKYYEEIEIGTPTKRISTVERIHGKLLIGEKLLLDNIDSFAKILWAPDGLKFAITQEVEGTKNNKLWIISRTGEKTLISDMPAYHSNIQWFPDSKRLLFTASTKEGSDIFIATIEK